MDVEYIPTASGDVTYEMNTVKLFDVVGAGPRKRRYGKWSYRPANAVLKIRCCGSLGNAPTEIEAVLEVRGPRILSGDRQGAQIATDSFRYRYTIDTGELRPSLDVPGHGEWVPLVEPAVAALAARLRSVANPTAEEG